MRDNVVVRFTAAAPMYPRDPFERCPTKYQERKCIMLEVGRSGITSRNTGLVKMTIVVKRSLQTQ